MTRSTGTSKTLSAQSRALFLTNQVRAANQGAISRSTMRWPTTSSKVGSALLGSSSTDTYSAGMVKSPLTWTLNRGRSGPAQYAALPNGTSRNMIKERRGEAQFAVTATGWSSSAGSGTNSSRGRWPIGGRFAEMPWAGLTGRAMGAALAGQYRSAPARCTTSAHLCEWRSRNSAGKSDFRPTSSSTRNWLRLDSVALRPSGGKGRRAEPRINSRLIREGFPDFMANREAHQFAKETYVSQ